MGQTEVSISKKIKKHKAITPTQVSKMSAHATTDCPYYFYACRNKIYNIMQHPGESQ